MTEAEKMMEAERMAEAEKMTEAEKKVKIRVDHAGKSFKSQQVLKDVCLTCMTGEITGIVGRNGSGKTVLFKAVCGLLLLDSGKIEVDGMPRKQGELLRQAGVIIEEPAFLGSYPGYKNLELLYMINHKKDRKYLEDILEQVGLERRSKKHVRKYSMGMKQRLALAQALMEKPDILILDEPFNGLDNQGVEEMRRLFLKLKAEGVTILVASHNAEDIRILCDSVYNMDGGVLTKVR